MSVTHPSLEPLVGAVVRLDPFQERDADELVELLLDPRLREAGYIMYPEPTSRDEALGRVWSEWAARRTGAPWERLSFAIRLVADSALVGDDGQRRDQVPAAG